MEIKLMNDGLLSNIEVLDLLRAKKYLPEIKGSVSIDRIHEIAAFQQQVNAYILT